MTSNTGGARRQRVVLAHGILSIGGWYRDARKVLSPHFECVPLRYWHYLAGPVAIVFEPRVMVLSLVVASIALMIAAIVPALIVLALGLILSFQLRGKWRDLTKRYLQRKYPDLARGAPHIVAHSWGTYLFVSLAERSSIVAADKAVLVGCVLHPRFDWRRLCQRGSAKHPRVKVVRNEVASEDWVVRIAEFWGRIDAEIGGAGVRGFEGSKEVVHTIMDPWVSCAQCVPTKAPVHNVLYRGIDHSDALSTEKHTRMFVLPELFGMTPLELRDLLELSHAVRELSELSATNWLDLLNRELYGVIVGQRWEFCDGTLYDVVGRLLYRKHFVTLSVQPNAEQHKRILGRIVLVLASIAEADIESRKKEPRLERARLLDPRLALAQMIGNSA